MISDDFRSNRKVSVASFFPPSSLGGSVRIFGKDSLRTGNNQSELDKSQKLDARMKTRWKSRRREKKTLRCYALQTLRKVNFTETVKRVVGMKEKTKARKKETYAPWWTLFFFSSEHFNDEIFLQRNFSSSVFCSVKDANKTFSHLGPYHKSQWSEFYSDEKKVRNEKEQKKDKTEKHRP